MHIWLAAIFITAISLAATASPKTSCPLGLKADEPIVVAVLDTGIDQNHSLLAPAQWRNPGETGFDSQGRLKETNGIDDDRNGLVDDITGWNFLDNNSDLTDRIGHGTHIAGLIESQGLVKAAGRPHATSPDVRLMTLKYSDKATPPAKATRSFSQALKYALKMGAHVINISGGGYANLKSEMELFKEAESKGVLVIAASGNKRPKQHNRAFFPSAYPFSNVYSVSATDESGRILPTSNQNPGQVQFLEKGYQVFSSLPGNRYGYLTGTSQAAAVFTGKLTAQLKERCLPAQAKIATHSIASK
jgi:subtilisin family serine protease